MRGLWLLACRNWASNRPRTALVTLAVCLGVAAAMGSLTTVVLIHGDFLASAQSTAGTADLEVRALGEQGFPASVADQVRAIPGVALVNPLLQKLTYFRTEQDRGFVQVAGVDPSAAMAGLSLRAGRWPEPGEDAVALSESWAAAEGLGLGADLELVTSDGPRSFKTAGFVAEIASAETGAGIGPPRAVERSVFLPLASAQHAFGMVDRSTHLEITLVKGADRDALVALLGMVVPGRFAVAQATPQSDALRLADEQLVAVLLLFGASALFVGALLIHNTLRLTVAEQKRSIGLLRAAGLLRGQVLLLILTEVLAIAVVGSVLGLVLGGVLAFGLAAWLQQGARLPVAGSAIQPQAIALSLILGLGTPLVSALVPAWRACCIAPMAAVRADAPGVGLAGNRWLLMTLLLVGGGACLLRTTPTEIAPVVRGLGLLMWLAMVYLALVRLSGPLAQFGATPFRWVCGAEGQLAEWNLRRAPQRTGLTVVGITFSVALATMLANLSSSAASAGQEQVAALFPEGVLIVPPVPQPERLADPFWKRAGGRTGDSTAVPVHCLRDDLVGRYGSRAVRVRIVRGAAACRWRSRDRVTPVGVRPGGPGPCRSGDHAWATPG